MLSSTGIETRLDRRAEIRDRAAALFAARGFGDASMAELADAVGIRKSSLYHFFPSKQALLMEVLRPVLEVPCQELREVVASEGSVPERFRAGATALGGTFERQPERMDILVRGRLERHLAVEQMEEIRAWKAEYTDLWRSLIKEGVHAEVFRPCDDKIAAFALIGALDWMYAWFQPSRPFTGAEVGAQIADYFLHGLLIFPVLTTGGDR